MTGKSLTVLAVEDVILEKPQSSSFYLSKNRLNSCSPNNWFVIDIGECDVFGDGSDQIGHNKKHSSSNPFLSNLLKPPFDHI